MHIAVHIIIIKLLTLAIKGLYLNSRCVVGAPIIVFRHDLLLFTEDASRFILEKRSDLDIICSQEDLPAAISFHT